MTLHAAAELFLWVALPCGVMNFLMVRTILRTKRRAEQVLAQVGQLRAEALHNADRAVALLDNIRAAFDNPKAVHEAMLAAPIDDKPYRQARAAIGYVVGAVGRTPS